MQDTRYFHDLYETLHGKQPFFGSGIEESLDRIPEEHLHVAVGHRTIGQLLEHMLAWRYDLIKRLHQEPRGKIELNSPQDWPDPTGKTLADYRAAFAQTKERLQSGLATFDAATLHDQLHPDYPYTNVQLLEGGAHHDIYHLGQINLIAAVLKDTQANNATGITVSMPS